MSKNPADTDVELAFSAGRYADFLVDTIYAIQFSLIAIAVAGFCLWFIAAPSDQGDWYLELLIGTIGLIAIAYLLTYLTRE